MSWHFSQALVAEYWQANYWAGVSARHQKNKSVIGLDGESGNSYIRFTITSVRIEALQ
jgi:hypothetical protein